MTTKLGLGVPLPLLLPVTGTALLPIGSYFIFHSLRIVYYRLSNKNFHDIYLSEKGQAASGNSLGEDPLYRANRSFGNYMENAPFALLLAGVAELNGANRKLLTYTLATWFTFRLLHAEAGLMIQNGIGFGRIIGFYGTQLWLGGMAVWNFLLVKDYWSA